ncbi:sulfurtransferase complex subunit TusB [Methanosarcina sp. UBA5]|uniref:sulfurtransferase complex subunit TusB n=1 Tax=Methanosarcina sp. UBA5 TaxID=1915593 RepID=UPI0025FFFC84|nr:sulfurtransferase complex subunit TusB [Methanosarcina sp. UBA5]
MKQEKLDVFLLTKPPFSSRSELCLKLAARSGKARLYLAGDGVYHLLGGVEEFSKCEIYACKEDLEARAIKAGKKVTVLDNFYSDFIEDIMEHCRHEYTY